MQNNMAIEYFHDSKILHILGVKSEIYQFRNCEIIEHNLDWLNKKRRNQFKNWLDEK